ncbi:hypothetical protein, partial [Actinoplanes philippinensis]|uniref:hypothetical protein n=1 Tax=Actinoplanes philippinensis TaxID=35752 RepID=UPI0033CE89B7
GVATPTGRSQLISRSATSADVLARFTPAEAWRDALRQVRDGVGDLAVTGTGDGHFQWVLTAGGRTVAESPPVYRDSLSCRRAFTDAQYAAFLALGGPAVPHPPGHGGAR